MTVYTNMTQQREELLQLETTLGCLLKHAKMKRS